jgi:alpha-tubulin suppressor-like RCC1 family protein
VIHPRSLRATRFSPLLAVVIIASLLVVAAPSVTAQAALDSPPPPLERSWYTPLVPGRLLDTRPGMDTVDGLGRPGSPLGPKASTTVPVLGRAGVPATGVSAVVLNVTVTNPTASSFLTIWPNGARRPVASNLNFVAGQTIANLVVAKVGSSGRVALYNLAGRVDVIVDVAGYVPVTDGFVPLVPARLLETRPGQSTVDGRGRPGVPLGARRVLELQVTGRGGVPSSGVDSVALNVTATNVTQASFLTIWPAGTTRPVASNLNMVPGRTVPNMVVAKVGAGGRVGIYNHSGSTDVIADVAGYFLTNGTFVSVRPARVFETRPGQFVSPGGTNREMRIGDDQRVEVRVTGVGGVPDFGVSAVILNVTAINADSASFLTVWPTGAGRPNASNLNLACCGQVTPNLVVAKVGAGGHVSLYNRAGNTDVAVDVAGYFLAETGLVRDLDVSARSTCALMEVGTLTCWGALPQDPELHYGGSQDRRPDPYEVNTVDDAVDLATGSSHTCVLRPAGDVWCWASPTVFDLAGTGGQYASNRAWPARRVVLPGRAVDVDASYSQTCALLADGTVWCWGRGYDGVTRSSAQKIANLDGAQSLSIGDDHGCSVRSGGGVRCGGVLNTAGTLGDGTATDSPRRAVDVAGLTDADWVSVNGLNTCATRTNGGARCWGRDFGSTPSDLVGVDAQALDDVAQVVGGDDFTCVLRFDGTVWCGTGATPPSAPVPGLSPIVYLAAGRFHVCAVDDLSEVYCWGLNGDGQVGDGTFFDRGSPRLVLAFE